MRVQRARQSGGLNMSSEDNKASSGFLFIQQMGFMHEDKELIEQV